MHSISVEQGINPPVQTEHRPATAVNTIIGTKVELAASTLRALLDPKLETSIEVFTKGDSLRLEKLNKYISLIEKLGYSVKTEDNIPVQKPEEKLPTKEEKKTPVKIFSPIQLGVPPPVVPVPVIIPIPVTQIPAPASEPVATDPANDFAPVGDPAPEPPAQVVVPAPAPQPKPQITRIVGDAGMSVSL